MQTREHLLAVIEPTVEGEAPLTIANGVVSRGGKATVLLVVTDRAREDFRRFAESENLGEGDALAVAVERLTDDYTSRVGGDDIATIVAESAPSSRQLISTATTLSATWIAIPQHLATGGELHKLVADSLVPVVVAPNRAA